ncbi:hypothetical protein JXL19_13240 [bacterium]|nr:hypothetical protein [bacterium]
MKRLVLGISLVLCLNMLFFSAAIANITGPHNISHKKGVCANCHVPHYAKGERIWARNLTDKFGGVRRLCNSCHDGTLAGNINSGYDDPNVITINSGIDTVFGTEYESHVMHGAVDFQRGMTDKIIGTYDYASFPVDPNDFDNTHDPAISEWDKGGEGFYCGSCHNVHKQPSGHNNDGDYLRTTSSGNPGKPRERADFCKQCHNPNETGMSHFSNTRCEVCHHPHEGKVRAVVGMSENEKKAARAIFTAGVVSALPFTAKPNVPEILDDSQDLDIASSAFCYGCHQPRHLLGPGDPNYTIWLEVGAAPIYGDTASDFNKNIDVKIKKPFEHHPMGKEAALNGMTKFRHATGTAATENLNKNGQITCISCHADLHGNTEGIIDPVKSKENNFLRWDFTDDNAYFCLKCHIDKSMGTTENDLYIQEDSKHFWKTEPTILSSERERVVYIKELAQNYETKIPCRQCMFCHFIHDGEERQSDYQSSLTIRPDVDCLMRFPAKVLITGERTRTQAVYYEDLCYGCHGDTDVVGGHGNGASPSALLKISPADFPGDYYFSHRFASIPKVDSPPAQALGKGKSFPLSDGPGDPNGVIDDYGTEEGEFYCGSCHNVHDSRVEPYLHYEPGDTAISPYAPDSFCEYCHDADSSTFQFVHKSHPIDVKFDNTPFPSEFDSGGSGSEYGITYNGSLICLTCHNVHSAATSWTGGVLNDPNSGKHGKLLVMDNFDISSSDGKGSDMCQKCHTF